MIVPPKAPISDAALINPLESDTSQYPAVDFTSALHTEMIPKVNKMIIVKSRNLQCIENSFDHSLSAIIPPNDPRFANIFDV
jgi:hypothetical protein